MADDADAIPHTTDVTSEASAHYNPFESRSIEIIVESASIPASPHPESNPPELTPKEGPSPVQTRTIDMACEEPIINKDIDDGESLVVSSPTRIIHPILVQRALKSRFVARVRQSFAASRMEEVPINTSVSSPRNRIIEARRAVMKHSSVDGPAVDGPVEGEGETATHARSQAMHRRTSSLGLNDSTSTLPLDTTSMSIASAASASDLSLMEREGEAEAEKVATFNRLASLHVSVPKIINIRKRLKERIRSTVTADGVVCI